MSKIILISCASKKQPSKAKAKDLYISPLFQKSLRYAQAVRPDKIFILSAKYGLVNLEQELEPYNETLNKMSVDANEQWAEKVREQIRGENIDFENDEITFLAGEKYRKNLEHRFTRKPSVPMRGLSIGKQLKYLNEQLKYLKECRRL
jgi:hypothetical protein